MMFRFTTDLELAIRGWRKLICVYCGTLLIRVALNGRRFRVHRRRECCPKVYVRS